MLINVGLRTDIVHHYTEWLFQRFHEGFAYSRNPLFPGRVTEYALDPEKVDAVLFCSKNYAPALARIREITSRFRTLFHYTVNAYGKDMEPNTPDFATNVETLRSLSHIVGKQRVFWRYDPILITKQYTASWHFENFERLAAAIAPYVSGCIVNFVEMANGLHERMPELMMIARSDRRDILMGIGSIGKKYSLPIRLCGIGGNDASLGIARGGCVNLSDIARANDCSFRDIKHEGNRRNCACIESRDLGWYNSCLSQCRYCNANRDPSSVRANYERHDPKYPLLIGTLRQDDTPTQSRQTSFLLHGNGQMSLF